ncbi:hypothetical protein [Phenylobacterium soli]|uniref:Uncharacterized protein n=1 Tax=Phenylobacterium soli TaxID=2170551 RepID=A0A328AAK4_9CAUL|nr:hypothetical protein [Phenylobacterium soli]RAK51605.1 hypothetical protein DJ017_17365 [Phenylobacterium soli]
MFRLPTLSEIIALFWQPTKVVHAIKGIETAAQRAESVVQFNQKATERLSEEEQELKARAEKVAAKSADHQYEAQRAARVSSRLRELTA